ncbi:MAG: hypothetical protein EOP86_16325 [Verrucomicrobiaceae bacterium]|nr:MAG: hypothetical protein EOP86_16325 [Verrucomicrobiaceae bacterium]
MNLKKPKNALQAVLNAQAASPPQGESASPEKEDAMAENPAAPAAKGTAKFARPSREGTRLIAGHFPPTVAKQLKILAAEEETSVQDLLHEALDLLFIKKGKSTIQKILRD